MYSQFEEVESGNLATLQYLVACQDFGYSAVLSWSKFDASPEDPFHEEKEEKFVAQPYRGTGAAVSKKSASSKGKSKGKDAKKKDEDTAKPKAKEKAKGDPEDQMSLLGVA